MLPENLNPVAFNVNHKISVLEIFLDIVPVW